MTKKIKLSEIDTTSGTQTRLSLCEDTLTDYAERMKECVKFPPVIVFHDGKQYYLADGFHRVLAAQRNEAVTIEADIRKGSCSDALKFALGANVTNGLRRTNADKRNCVEIALNHFGGMVDNEIARLCGVSHTFVSNVRQVATVATCPNSPRKGKDGKYYPVNPVKTVTPRQGDGAGEININEEGGKDERYHDPGSQRVDVDYSMAEKDNGDSENIIGLKRYYRQASVKDRKKFMEWVKESFNK